MVVRTASEQRLVVLMTCWTSCGHRFQRSLEPNSLVVWTVDLRRGFRSQMTSSVRCLPAQLTFDFLRSLEVQTTDRRPLDTLFTRRSTRQYAPLASPQRQQISCEPFESFFFMVVFVSVRLRRSRDGSASILVDIEGTMSSANRGSQVNPRRQDSEADSCFIINTPSRRPEVLTFSCVKTYWLDRKTSDIRLASRRQSAQWHIPSSAPPWQHYLSTSLAFLFCELIFRHVHCRDMWAC